MTPQWITKAMASIPGLREAWEDPLFEHWRERQQVRTWRHLISAEGWAVVVVCAVAISLPALFAFPAPTPGVAFFGPLAFAILGAQKIARTFLDHRSDPLAFLSNPAHPLWKEVPIDADRAAGLVALKAMVDGLRPFGTIYTRGVQFSGFYGFGIALLLAQGFITGPTGRLALLGFAVIVALVAGVGRAVEKHYLNPVGDCAFIGICAICSFAERMAFPPLSKDATATSNEKKARYSEFVFEATSTGIHRGRAIAIIDNDGMTPEMKVIEIYKNALDGFSGCWKRWAGRGADVL